MEDAEWYKFWQVEKLWHIEEFSMLKKDKKTTMADAKGYKFWHVEEFLMLRKDKENYGRC